MSHYKPYPAYKDSGVEWIGLVPEHWKVAQIKRISALNPKEIDPKQGKGFSLHISPNGEAENQCYNT
ncbi:hypothetical protein [Klebsiella pneumoniae]|uniref:hypothetical protein n=1 Tax=Klebsiella pneumoniae TaxID=573 RepID=UPI00388DDBCD